MEKTALIARGKSAHGLADAVESEYVDASGNRHAVPLSSLKAIRRAIGNGSAGKEGHARQVIVHVEGDDARIGPARIHLEDGSTLTVADRLPPDVPLGYHELSTRDGGRARLIVAPATCFLPDALRIWGWAIQLYAARSRRSWGIGDLADLRWLGRWGRRAGAGIALINPLAAPAPTLPQQPSPYFPSSRRFRSPLYLRVEEVDGAGTLADLSAIAQRGRAMHADQRIDRDDVFRLKMGALERIWGAVRRRPMHAFDRFRMDAGPGLEEFSRFSALAEKFETGWHAWPAEFRHPSSAAVRAAAGERVMADRIRFHEWLQFQVDAQLLRASRQLPVMQDLPIGFDADGADAWAFQDVLADGVSVGAPPDEFNTRGQNWGLPPFVPHKLRAAGYAPFIDTIRACVRHAGGLRIDHVMGLFRLFWIPSGLEAREGAYVRSNARELLAIVALESQRARAVIVGEDLGTVEEEARTRLTSASILSYRLLWFEKGAPAKYPEQALAAVTTHDLPTVAGLWTGADLRAQKAIGLSPNEKGTREIQARVRRLTKASATTPLPAVIARAYAALGTAPSSIVTATLEDAMMVEKRPNMPATTDEWPNWSMPLPRPIETLETDPLARRIARSLERGARGGSGRSVLK